MGHYNLTRVDPLPLAGDTHDIPPAINTFTSGEVAHRWVIAVTRGGDTPHMCAGNLALAWRNRSRQILPPFGGREQGLLACSAWAV